MRVRGGIGLMPGDQDEDQDAVSDSDSSSDEESDEQQQQPRGLQSRRDDIASVLFPS